MSGNATSRTRAGRRSALAVDRVREPIMSLALTSDGSAKLVTVSGEVDMSSAHLLTELVECVCRLPVPVIAVDLSAVRFFSAHAVSWRQGSQGQADTGQADRTATSMGHGSKGRRAAAFGSLGLRLYQQRHAVECGTKLPQTPRSPDVVRARGTRHVRWNGSAVGSEISELRHLRRYAR